MCGDRLHEVLDIDLPYSNWVVRFYHIKATLRFHLGGEIEKNKCAKCASFSFLLEFSHAQLNILLTLVRISHVYAKREKI